MEMRDVVDYLSNMKVIDIISLTRELEEKWGVSCNPVIEQQQAPPKEEKEEQVEFDVILISYGEKKINVVKAVREISSMGLKEAKEFVESAPKALAECVSNEIADDMVAKLKEAGAIVEIK